MISKSTKKTVRQNKTRKSKGTTNPPIQHWLDRVLEPAWAWRTLYRT